MEEQLNELLGILDHISDLLTLPQDKVVDFCNDFMKNNLNYGGEQALFFSEGYRDGFDHAIQVLKLIVADGLKIKPTDEVKANLVMPLFNEIKNMKNERED